MAKLAFEYKNHRGKNKQAPDNCKHQRIRSPHKKNYVIIGPGINVGFVLLSGIGYYFNVSSYRGKYGARLEKNENNTIRSV
jgi:hypothetical protein